MAEQEPIPFNENAGRAVQFGIAQALIRGVGSHRFTPEAIKALARPLNTAIRETERDFLEQEVWARELMGRFVGMIAWIAADGNPEEAKRLIGSSLDQSGVDVDSPQFVSTMQEMIDRNRR